MKKEETFTSHELRYPSANKFSDLFEAVYHDKLTAPKPFKLHKNDAIGCELSSYCSVDNKGEFYYFYVKPRPSVVSCIEKNSLAINYESMYFKIVVREDGQALIAAQNNKIIGGPWLSMVDASSIPKDESDE